MARAIRRGESVKRPCAESAPAKKSANCRKDKARFAPVALETLRGTAAREIDDASRFGPPFATSTRRRSRSHLASIAFGHSKQPCR